jgi:hypothetical protein
VRVISAALLLSLLASGDAPVLTDKAMLGCWNGFGGTYFKRVGKELWGAYGYKDGTVVGNVKDRVFHGWWTQQGTREPPFDAGEVEFIFALGDRGKPFLDGRFKYGPDGAWNENWDLRKCSSEDDVPVGLKERFKEKGLFKRHP